MGFTEQEAIRVGEIDSALRDDDTSDLFITGYDDGFFGWYARLLSTLVIATNGRDIVFANTDIEGTVARFVLATNQAVFSAEVQDISADENVYVHIAPVTAIKALSVSADMRFDVKGSRKVGWPGGLTVDATFEGFGPVRFQGSSYDTVREDRIGDISRLLTMLRTQLGV